MRVVINTPNTLRLHCTDEGGMPVQPAAVPEVTVFRSDGTALDGADAPSAVVEANALQHLYTATLPPVDEYDVLTVQWTWSASGETYERLVSDPAPVVSRRVVDPRLYRLDPELAGLDTETLLLLSDIVDSWMEDALNFYPVKRAYDITWNPQRATTGLRVPGIPYPQNPVKALYIDDQPMTDDQLADLDVVQGVITRGVLGWGFLTGAGCTGWRHVIGRKVRAVGVCGPRPEWGDHVPEDLVRACVVLGRYANRQNNYPERARQIVTQGAMIQFSVPAPNKPTSLPEVDSAVVRYALNSAV